MDPYLLTRIGDVTIQRVLPKQDVPTKDTITENQVTPPTEIPAANLNLSAGNPTSIDKREDEGGGESDKSPDYSDASDEDDGDISQMEDEEDDPNVPLSLVTKRNPINSLPLAANSSITITPVAASGTVKQDESKHSDMEMGELECKSVPENKYLSESDDDDLPLSRLLAEAQSAPADFIVDEAFRRELDKAEGSEEKPMNEDAFEDAEPESEEEAEDGVDGEGQGMASKDQEQEQEQDQGSGDEDPDREMIVVKQEPLDEEGEEDEMGSKRKMAEGEDESEETSTKKSKKGSGKESGSESDTDNNSQSGIDKKNAEKKLVNLRKNIREVMDEAQLDEATLAAQRQEMERLQRVQEQQRIIREVNRQINLNRQNSKTQSRVISLLQSGGTSLLKASPSAGAGAAVAKSTSSPNTVLVKLGSGSGPPQVVNKKVLEILRSTKTTTTTTSTSKAAALATKLLNKTQSLTPSVSIAPVKSGLTITKMGKAVEDDKVPGAKAKQRTKQKGKDVVMISSSSSDEDDCILISEPSDGEEEEEEEDPTNSGMHTNDLYNVPDDQGRVLINVGRPENEPDVFLAPQIARIIKPHQIGGVRFLFDNVVESLERFKTSTGFGCILAHSMGLGKTLQVVSFCDVFLRYTTGKSVLCIMPINTLQNWVAEFNMWLPVEPANSPFAAHGDVQPRMFPIFVLNDLQKTMVARAKVVAQWASEGGVLMIGYELYRQLALQKPRKRRGTSKRKVNPDDDMEDEKNKQLLEEVYAALVKPGPDLVICDEGHRIKNTHASISNALKQIRSKRRVVLTGYPLQNNLVEYWCMVDFVRPNYLGSKTEFSNMFERPIQNGQCIDSTPQDIRLMRYRAHVLHSLLEGFVQRRSHAVLTNALPQKEEYVILVRLTKFQRLLYDTFMNEVVRTKAVPNPLKAFAVCCKIWNHPDVLYDFLKRRMMGTEAVDLDLEETAGALAPVGPIGVGTVSPMMGLAPNIVLPTKRARGRSPKAPSSSPGRRDRRSTNRKRGGTEADSPVKSPMVAAVMPNTTSGSQPAHDPHVTQQADIKPMTQARYPAGPPNLQYPGYPHTNDYQNAPPSYPGFNNQQGFNNQNMYSNFGGGSYQSSYQDPHFNGSNYWNSNPAFYNEHSNPGMFPGYNESDPGAQNYYNQDMMGTDGYMGPRGYNGGMGMNRGMSGMNPMPHGRMGMNNSSHGMMPPMNSMGMPSASNMNPNMGMNQNNYGMNSMGMNSMGPQGSGIMTQNIGMNHTQGVAMGMIGPQGHGGMNVPSTQGMGMSSQSSSFGMGNDSSQSSNQNPSSGGMPSMTDTQVNLMNNASNQSLAESQQQAAIENIANNLMMSSQQSLKSTTGLIGGGESHNTSNMQPKQPPRPSTHDMNSHPEMHGEGPLPPFGTAGLLNTPSLLGGLPPQHGMQPTPTNMMNPGRPQQNSRNYPTSTITSAQSHMMENMAPNAQAAPNVRDSQSSSAMMGYESSNDNQPLSSSGHHAHMLNQAPSNSQSMGNHPNQPFHSNQGPSAPNVMGNAPNPIFRHQQPNQGMFGQQGPMSMMDSTGMYGNSQPLPHMMGSSHNPMMNQHHMANQNVIGSGGMTALDHTNLNNQPPPGNQQLSSSQNQMLGNSDPVYSTSTVTSQQSMGSQDSHGGYNQHSYGNQSTSNPMGNLQNMLNNQNMMQAKPQTDVGASRDQSHQSLMPMNSPAQSSVQATPSGAPQSDPMMGHNMMPSQHNSANPSSSLIDNQSNMYGMSQPGQYMNNQSMMNSGVRNPPSMQSMMGGGSQNMGMVMNNSAGQGMYGSHMNPHDMNSGMMGNHMPNAPFNQNQMGCGNMMGSYNQPGINYPGSMMGNQMNNYSAMNQQGMNTPNSNFSQSQPFGSNVSRSQPDLGMRNPPAAGLNPDLNQGVNNSFGNNQGNFGTFGNNMASNSFNPNQNNPASRKASIDSFQSNSNSITNSRFMSGGEFQTGNSQSSSQDLGNVSQNTFGNDFSNFGLNSEDGKLWEDMTKPNDNSANSTNPVNTANPDKVNPSENNSVKKESDMSSHDSKLKTEDIKSPSVSTKPKIDEDLSGNKDFKKEESKSPKVEGGDAESKDAKESKENNPENIGAAASNKTGREDPGIPYDWATELLKDYVPGDIEASAKMALLFCILEESMYLGDRLLVFSQSLLTLNLVEDFLQRKELPGRQEKWARNWNYYRLDGSTSAMEREKLINEFNSNPNIHLFLVSTRAGSLGINLVGANRVVVLDASWNPCHDTQAVCRVYRYGQRKPCFVYRLVTDNCLEKKIYDRQINKQGMADRVVDECNPDAHLSIKEVTNLCWDNEEESKAVDFSDKKDKYIDVVMQKVIEKYSYFLSKEPFQHESLLVDRKDKKLSSAEKRLAKRSYELEKQASANNTRPAYGYYPGNTGTGRGNPMMKPMASVRPMQSELNNQLIRDASSGRPRQWIPAEVWQKQGMSAQEMTLPLDVVIPTNSPDRSSIVLKAGQKVMVLKSPKGIYMQLENGKIIAIRTAFKVGAKGDKKGAAANKDTLESGIKKMVVQPTRQRAPASLLPLRNNSNISIIPRSSGGPRGPKPLVRFMGARPGLHKQPVAATRPYFGERASSSSSALPPVTVTVTKKRVPSGSQPPSTSAVRPQVDIRRESKQLTVTPIPPPSPKTASALLSKPVMRNAMDSPYDSPDAKDASSSSSDSESTPLDKF